METVRTKKVAVIIGVGILGLLAFLAVGIAVQRVFSATAAGVVALLFAAALGCAYAMLYQGKTEQYIINAVILLEALLIGMFSLTSLIGGVLLFIFLSAGSHLITTAVGDGITFKLQTVLLPGLRMIVAGIAIMVVTLALPEVRHYVANGGFTVSPAVVEYLSRPATPFVQNVFPGYSADQTINQIVDAQIQQQTQGLPAGFELPAQQRSIAVQNLSSTLGVPLSGSEKASDVLAAVINNYIRKISMIDGVLVTVILAGIGLLATRALVPVLSWIAFGFAYGMFMLAKQFGLVTIQKQQLPVDRLTL